MKASEVVQLYQQGERDFRRMNLRGQSFKGQDLSGADFSEADIRSANFKGAILRGVQFRGAKAGLQKRWAIILVFISLLISALSGFLFGIVGYLVSLIFDSSLLENQISGWTALIVLIIFYIVMFRKGLVTALGAFAFAFAGVSGYVGWRAIKGDPRDAWIRTIALVFASMGGTSFYKADLTDADFTRATLKSTDLRANLTRTCWKDTVKLDLARVGQTLLSQAEVRELLISGYGYNKSYLRKNLRGANLARANLNKANLKWADLSEATLADANLDEANLTEVDAIGADFTHANMTGTCIEVWNIDSSTKLNQVDCQYVYLLESPKPGTDDRERRPSSGIFQPGEFTKLFEEVLDTVDLIFRNGVDWKAFVAAFKKVQVENEDTLLEIQGIENKGDGVVVVKVKVPPDTDKEKIHQDFTQNYELALQAVEEYKAQLEAKNKEIVDIYRQKSIDIMEITKLLATQQIKLENKIMSQQGQFGIGHMSGGTITGNAKVAGVINEAQQQKLPDVAAKIEDLLNYFQEHEPTITEAKQIVKTAIEHQPELEDANIIEAAIENSPTLKQRLKAAGEAAYVETVKILLPPLGVAIEAVKGWQNPK